MSQRLIVFSLVGALAFSQLGCESAGKKTAAGAGIGAVAGAALGAVAGKITGDSKKGALIGAAIGASLGGVVGNRLDKQQKELDKIAETKRTERGLMTKLKSDILFDTGKADLKPEAQANLAKLAKIMKKYPENVLLIKGYTDSTGSEKVNMMLSQKRAAAVQAVLVANGVPGGTVSVEGMGPKNPIADNKTPEARAQNRRVEIEISVDESKVPKDAKG